MKWNMPMKEITIMRRTDGYANITPVDLEGTTHHSNVSAENVDLVMIYYGATTTLLKEGNTCIRGNRLIIEVDFVKGNAGRCMTVKVTDTSGEEPR